MTFTAVFGVDSFRVKLLFTELACPITPYLFFHSFTSYVNVIMAPVGTVLRYWGERVKRSPTVCV
jgi:hypothetical protein